MFYDFFVLRLCNIFAHFLKNYSSMKSELFHEPVLKEEVLALLFFDEVHTVFDGTLGLGGHAESILEHVPQITRYVACDLDSQHLAFARKRLQKWDKKIELHHSSFLQVRELLEKMRIDRPLVILLDLGLCSNQVDDPTKGFSFESEGPLSLSFDDSQEGAAAHLLNTASQKRLGEIFKLYGEERRAHAIARKIIQTRKETPFQTTSDLRKLLEDITPPHQRKKTLVRVFQALRIVVNDELTVLQNTLTKALEVLKSGDRIGVIAYHSLEDRIVKRCFAAMGTPVTEPTERSLHTVVRDPDFRLLTSKPIKPTSAEILRNPRSRSARFRILEKI